MRSLRAFVLRLRGLFSSRRAEHDFDAEFESRVALHTDDGIRSVLTPAEARRQALIRLGGAEQTRQAYRERRRLPFLETLGQDAAYAFRVLRWVLRHGGRLATIGVATGLAAALALTQVMAHWSMVYGVHAYDPWTLTVATVLLVAVALAACYVPARRAASIDPMQALRTE